MGGSMHEPEVVGTWNGGYDKTSLQPETVVYSSRYLSLGAMISKLSSPPTPRIRVRITSFSTRVDATCSAVSLLVRR